MALGFAPALEKTRLDPDATLVAAVRLGDRTRYDELVARHQTKILRLARSITRQTEDAEDVAQDSFVLAYRHLASFHGEACFHTWLSRITVNQSLSKLRRRRSREAPLVTQTALGDEGVPFEIVDSSPSPEARCVEREENAMVARAVGKLKPAFRRAVQLYYMEQFTTEETAQALNLSLETAKTHLHRARLKLRKMLVQRA